MKCAIPSWIYHGCSAAYSHNISKWHQSSGRAPLPSRLSVTPLKSRPLMSLCSISVWLLDSRLKQALIIPLVKHADKSCFFISNSSEFAYSSTFRRHVIVIYLFYVSNCSFCTSQGEIGEKGQKVRAELFEFRLQSAVLIWLFCVSGRTRHWSQRARRPSRSTGTKGELNSPFPARNAKQKHRWLQSSWKSN